jgi:hypothetical protein
MHKYIGTDLDKDYMFITRNKQALIKSYGKEAVEKIERSITSEYMKRCW